MPHMHDRFQGAPSLDQTFRGSPQWRSWDSKIVKRYSVPFILLSRRGIVSQVAACVSLWSVQKLISQSFRVVDLFGKAKKKILKQDDIPETFQSVSVPQDKRRSPEINWGPQEIGTNTNSVLFVNMNKQDYPLREFPLNQNHQNF